MIIILGNEDMAQDGARVCLLSAEGSWMINNIFSDHPPDPFLGF